MKATELLAAQMETTKGMVVPMLEDLVDAPLTAPTTNGGNHPLWIAGHVVYSEAALTTTLMFDKPHPFPEWGELYGRGAEPTLDEGQYTLTIPEILAKWEEVRQNTLAELAQLSDDDLDRTVANCPPGREAFFGTLGKAFTAVAVHPVMHRGQLADSRRVLGRPPLIA